MARSGGPYWENSAADGREHLIPDLRGHDRSPHAAHYSYEHYAADVADLLEHGELDACSNVTRTTIRYSTQSGLPDRCSCG